MALVLKSWSASATPDAAGVYVNIVGRQAGLISWLLSLMGIDPITSIEIKGDIIHFAQGSLEGTERRVIPISSVCSAYYGYKKPWKEAVAIGVVLMPVFFIGVVAGPLYYFLNKTLTVGVIEVSGWVGGFSFKRSVIEGKEITENEAHAVIEIIRTLIEKKTVH